MRSFVVLSGLAVLLVSSGVGHAFAASPGDYFPLDRGNHWRYYTQWDVTNPDNDRMSYIDVVDTVTFHIPGEILSHRVQYAEGPIASPHVYRTTFYAFNVGGDLCWTAFEEPGEPVNVFDAASIYLRNPIAVDDTTRFINEGLGVVLTITVESVTDTLDLPIGQFENCLRIREHYLVDGEIHEVAENVYIPWTETSRGFVAGIGRSYSDRYTDGVIVRQSASWLDSLNVSQGPMTDVAMDLPTGGVHVYQNRPNPFNPRTAIAFDLSRDMAVSLCVYDVAGRLVDVLLNDEIARQGRNEVTWHGRDMEGRIAPAGVYFYRLEAGDYVETKRMTLLK